ncbi:MAG: hypothetical protein ABW185_14125, partial [Sedimenticola sp.]
QCCKHGYVPNGLTIKLPIELDIEEECLQKCERIKNDSSLKMMEVMVRGIEVKCSNLEDEICICADNLAETSKELHSTAMDNVLRWKLEEERKSEGTNDGKWSNI